MIQDLRERTVREKFNVEPIVREVEVCVEEDSVSVLRHTKVSFVRISRTNRAARRTATSRKVRVSVIKNRASATLDSAVSLVV